MQMHSQFLTCANNGWHNTCDLWLTAAIHLVSLVLGILLTPRKKGIFLAQFLSMLGGQQQFAGLHMEVFVIGLEGWLLYIICCCMLPSYLFTRGIDYRLQYNQSYSLSIFKQIWRRLGREFPDLEWVSSSFEVSMLVFWTFRR